MRQVHMGHIIPVEGDIKTSRDAVTSRVGPLRPRIRSRTRLRRGKRSQNPKWNHGQIGSKPFLLDTYDGLSSTCILNSKTFTWTTPKVLSLLVQAHSNFFADPIFELLDRCTPSLLLIQYHGVDQALDRLPHLSSHDMHTPFADCAALELGKPDDNP